MSGQVCPFLSGMRQPDSIAQIFANTYSLPIEIPLDLNISGDPPNYASGNMYGSIDISTIAGAAAGVGEGELELIRQNCIGAECMMWNNDLSICNLTKYGATQDYFETVLGTEQDRYTYGDAPLIKLVSDEDSPLSKILGTEENLQDVYGNPVPPLATLGGILPYLREVLGNEQNKLDMDEQKNIMEMLEESSLQEYLNVVVGTENAKGEHPPLVGVTRLMAELKEYLENILGTEEDKNEELEKILHLTKLLPYFRNVIGEEEDLDMEKSLVSYLIKVIGKEEEADLSLMAYMQHIHHQHLHFLPHDYDRFDKRLFGHLGGIGSIPKASVLVNEFMGNEDLDGNGQIYGIHFKIGDDPSKPVILRGLEQHPSWPDPSIAVSWGAYLQSLEDSY